jgi:hypothetical protein
MNKTKTESELGQTLGILIIDITTPRAPLIILQILGRQLDLSDPHQSFSLPEIVTISSRP